MKETLSSSCYVFCLSQEIKETYQRFGVDENRLITLGNGANVHLFNYSPLPKKPDRSIFLAKVTRRKRQYLYQSLEDIDFVGNKEDRLFDYKRANYLGEWPREKVYLQLTDYANLVLLSDGEADPLVTKEALAAGVGLVISEQSAANLDVNLPFIDVIPEKRIHQLDWVAKIIAENRAKSLLHRDAIRRYALQSFSWSKIIDQYVEIIQRIVQRPAAP